MSKAYSKVFLSSLLFIASIIGWGLSMRNTEASSSGIENAIVEQQNVYLNGCQPFGVSDGLVTFEISPFAYDTFRLDFRKNDRSGFKYDGFLYVQEWVLDGNRWRYMGDHKISYYAGQRMLMVTDSTDQYRGVYYRTWWKSSTHYQWTYTGHIECSYD